MTAQTLEPGAASLTVAVEGGRLTVTHGTDGVILLEGPLPAGGWNRLVSTLCAIAPKAIGPMRKQEQAPTGRQLIAMMRQEMDEDPNAVDEWAY